MNNRKARHKHIRELKKLYVIEYLKTHPCIDCGQLDIRVLDFDHTYPSQKRSGIARIAGAGTYSLAYLVEEIAKCEVRCSNCHRIKTIGSPEWFVEFEIFKSRVQQAETARLAKKPTHGMRRMYLNGCRCVDCTIAQRDYARKRRALVQQQNEILIQS